MKYKSFPKTRVEMRKEVEKVHSLSNQSWPHDIVTLQGWMSQAWSGDRETGRKQQQQ